MKNLFKFVLMFVAISIVGCVPEDVTDGQSSHELCWTWFSGDMRALGYNPVRVTKCRAGGIPAAGTVEIPRSGGMCMGTYRTPVMGSWALGQPTRCLVMPSTTQTSL